MSQKLRMTYPTAIVAQALAAGFQYGFDIAEATLLRPATVYRVLRRLEELEFVEAEWEDATIAHREGRPPRRYYTLRTDSAELLKSARGRFPALALVADATSTARG